MRAIYRYVKKTKEFVTKINFHFFYSNPLFIFWNVLKAILKAFVFNEKFRSQLLSTHLMNK